MSAIFNGIIFLIVAYFLEWFFAIEGNYNKHVLCGTLAVFTLFVYFNGMIYGMRIKYSDRKGSGVAQ